MAEEENVTQPPPGDYAIAECLGHRTLIGRVAEVERFGTKMLQIEPIFQGKLLPAIFVGGGSLYAFTPCSAETAFRQAPRADYQLPNSLRATLPPEALPAPVPHDEDQDLVEVEGDESNDGEPEF